MAHVFVGFVFAEPPTSGTILRISNMLCERCGNNVPFRTGINDDHRSHWWAVEFEQMRAAIDFAGQLRQLEKNILLVYKPDALIIELQGATILDLTRTLYATACPSPTPAA